MIALVPIGQVEDAVFKSLAPPLTGILGQEAEVAKTTPLPSGGWIRSRRQYLASTLLALVPVPARGDRALGIATVDLYAPGLNFVFGIADTEGRRALISLARLRPEFYGSPPDDTLFLQRAVKEAVHELGHTFGLGHCRDPRCIMFFSNTLHDTDVKGPGFCAACREKVSLRGA
jgi:archaemetzincin